MCIRLRFPIQIAAALALACASAPPPMESAAPAPDLIATTFQGQVEIGEGEPLASVIVSTATEEVVVAPGAVAEELRVLAGRMVILRGWVVDAPQEALVMVVISFEVAGEQRSRVSR